MPRGPGDQYAPANQELLNYQFYLWIRLMCQVSCRMSQRSKKSPLSQTIAGEIGPTLTLFTQGFPGNANEKWRRKFCAKQKNCEPDWKTNHTKRVYQWRVKVSHHAKGGVGEMASRKPYRMIYVLELEERFESTAIRKESLTQAPLFPSLALRRRLWIFPVCELEPKTRIPLQLEAPLCATNCFHHSLSSTSIIGRLDVRWSIRRDTRGDVHHNKATLCAL